MEAHNKEMKLEQMVMLLSKFNLQSLKGQVDKNDKAIFAMQASNIRFLSSLVTKSCRKCNSLKPPASHHCSICGSTHASSPFFGMVALVATYQADGKTEKKGFPFFNNIKSGFQNLGNSVQKTFSNVKERFLKKGPLEQDLSKISSIPFDPDFGRTLSTAEH